MAEVDRAWNSEDHMIIGIDPGNTGAIAALNDAYTLIDVVDMPLMANGKKQQVNASKLAGIIFDFAGYLEATVYLERVHAMPGQGVTSMFNFGMGYGVLQGVIATIGLPVMMVTPHSWKKKAGLLGKDKDNARTLAQQLYPGAPLGRKKDIGRADAILIARFGHEARVA